MRTLSPPPNLVVTPDGSPRFGSFAGSLPRVDLGPLGKPLPYRLLHHKRWVYLAIASGDVFVGLAVVNLGYATNTFAFAFERTRGMLADCSTIGHFRSAAVADSFDSGPTIARFSSPRANVSIVRAGDTVDVDARFSRELVLRARLDAKVSHPALSAIGPIPGGMVNATEKQALLPVTGELTTSGESRSLDGAFGGWDYTHGYLARHTQWRWAYLLGRTREGQRVGMNLVQGFLGETECAVWLVPEHAGTAGDELHPVGEGRFEFDARDPLAPWRITTTCGAVDLRFSPGGMHAEDKDFKLLKSKFVQPVGTYEGTIRVGNTTATLERVLGVAEDQDVLW